MRAPKHLYCWCGTGALERRLDLDQKRFDCLTMPYFTNNRRLNRGGRHGPSHAQAEDFRVWQSYQRALEHTFKFIHDQLVNGSLSRDSQLAMNWTKGTCLQMEELAEQDHHHVSTRRERFCKIKKPWRFTQRRSGKQTVTRHRDDYREAHVKFREAQQTAMAKGAVVTQSTPWKEHVRQ